MEVVTKFKIHGSQATRAAYFLRNAQADFYIKVLDEVRYINELIIVLPNSDRFETIRDLAAVIAESSGLSSITLEKRLCVEEIIIEDLYLKDKQEDDIERMDSIKHCSMLKNFR